MTQVFVWTFSDIVGLVALGILAAMFIPLWIYEKVRKWRAKK